MSGSGSLRGPDGLSLDELRAAVRAVLHEVLPSAATQAAPAGEVEPERVTLQTDAELDAFVRRVATLCEDSSVRADIRDGARRFSFGPSQPTAGSKACGMSDERPGLGVHRVEQGAVTERRVKQAAADGVRLVIGRKAVLTPLARDRARTLGVVVEKEH
jgi:hypothetical protein